MAKGDETGFDRYRNPDQPIIAFGGPWRIDFPGMVADGFKAFFVLVLSIGAGFVIALQKSAGEVFDAIIGAIQMFALTLASLPQITIGESVQAARGDIDVFGFFALPASAAIILATLFGIALMIAIFLDV